MPLLTRRRDVPAIGLVLVLAIALGLRLWGLRFGLPHSEARPDEGAAVSYAYRVWNGEPNPGFFHWPSLHFYTLAALYGVAGVARRMAGLPPELPDFSAYLMVGRAYAAAAGTLTVYVLFRVARAAGGSTVGLVSAFFLAVAPLHVRESHFGLTDVPMTLLVVLSLGMLLHALATCREVPNTGAPIGRFALSGLLAGLATSTKYSAAALVASLSAAQLWLLTRSGWHVRSLRTWLPAALWLAALAVGFLAATPYALLDAETFIRDVTYDVTHLSDGHGAVRERGWVRHARLSLRHGVGTPMLLAGLLGVIALARHNRSVVLVVGAFAVAFYLAIGSGLTAFARYVLPLVPLLCLSAAWLMVAIGSALAPRLRIPTGLVVALLSVAVAAPSLATSMTVNRLLARVDTRVLARNWIEAHIPPGSTVHETGSLHVRLNLHRLPFALWQFDEDTGTFANQHDDLPEWIVVHTSPLPDYTRVPSSLVDLLARHYRQVHAIDATRPDHQGVYDEQDAFFLPVAGFRGVLRPGPTISIYQRR